MPLTKKNSAVEASGVGIHLALTELAKPGVASEPFIQRSPALATSQHLCFSIIESRAAR